MEETQKIKNALSYIDPDVSYSEWLSIGMALHSWDKDIGFIEWDLWSKNGNKYDWRYLKDKWDSFNGSGITLKTLFHMAKENGWSKEEEKEENEETMSIDPSVFPHLALTKRKISAEVCKLYSVHTSVMESDGKTLDKSYFPYKKNGIITGWHVRNHNPKDKRDKIQADIGTGSGNLDLFGKEVASRSRRKRLFITEGRIDCLSLAETFKEYTKREFKGFDGIVSINNGSGSALKDCLNNREFIESFQEVILVFDADEDGRKAVSKVLKSFPRFKVAKLPEGLDCNEMRLQGRDKELYDLVMWKATHERQGKVVDVIDVIDKVMLRPTRGLSFPWPTVDKLTYGIRPNNVHVIGAAPKIGKSDHEYQLIHHISYKLNQKVGVFDLENPPQKTIKKVTSKEIGIDVTNPERDYDDALLNKKAMELNGKVRFYDRGASRVWEDIKVAIEEMHLLDGINIFIIDPLTALVSREKTSDANDKLNEICTDMADWVYMYPITIFCYSHVNPKPKGMKAHDDGGRVLSSEFRGSRAMEQWFHYGWGIRRNRSPDCPPEEQNISYLDLLFDRDFGNSGTATLFFNKDDMSYKEI